MVTIISAYTFNYATDSYEPLDTMRIDDVDALLNGIPITNFKEVEISKGLYSSFCALDLEHLEFIEALVLLKGIQVNRLRDSTISDIAAIAITPEMQRLTTPLKINTAPIEAYRVDLGKPFKA